MKNKKVFKAYGAKNYQEMMSVLANLNGEQF